MSSHFRNQQLDAYLGDYPILDYARVKLDPKCKLKMLDQAFGEDEYGIGLPKGSPLKVSVSVYLYYKHKQRILFYKVTLHVKGIHSRKNNQFV